MKKILSYLVVILFVSCSTQPSQEIINNPTSTLRTTRIGNQIWTSTNLDVVRYNNGDPIPQITNPTEWRNATYGAWCYYNNDSTTLKTQGRIYNFYSVIDSRGIAPSGFKVPNKNDWQILSDYLGGDSLAGGKLKSDSMKFNINFTGCRGEEGAFCFDGRFQGFWTVDSSWSCYCGVTDWYGSTRLVFNSYNLTHNINELLQSNAKKFYGYSVRCLKN
jgi:uncharacterized protein (TIGR02145 family)